jgi:hypothetical protein
MQESEGIHRSGNSGTSVKCHVSVGRRQVDCLQQPSYQRKKAYTCMICRRRIVRDGDSVGGPMPDAHDYA